MTSKVNPGNLDYVSTLSCHQASSDTPESLRIKLETAESGFHAGSFLGHPVLLGMSRQWPLPRHFWHVQPFCSQNGAKGNVKRTPVIFCHSVQHPDNTHLSCVLMTLCFGSRWTTALLAAMPAAWDSRPPNGSRVQFCAGTGAVCSRTSSGKCGGKSDVLSSQEL